MAMSETAAASLLNTLFGKTNTISIAPTCYIGLLTEEPYEEDYTTSSGSTTTTAKRWVFTEPPVEAGYERVFMSNYQSASMSIMGTPDKNKITNSAAIGFNAASENWGTITHFALYTAKTGGTPYMWGELSVPIEIPIDYVPIFRPGKFSIEIQ